MFEYDRLGRLTAVVDALHQRTQYTYDEAGNLLSQRDANGHVTRYEYDGLGRRIATVLPLTQRSTTVYNAVGNVSRTTDFNGDTIVFGYDVDNRLTSNIFPDSTSVQFTYNVTGQRETYIDARGATRWAYDIRDRLVTRTDPDGRAISYAYDAAGNRTSLTVPSGTTAYTFDELNRTATVTDPEGGLTRYTYDAGSRLVRSDLPNGTFETRQYDVVNHLLFLENRNSTSVISSYRYTLDATGNRTAVVEDTGRRVNYAYDEIYRLIGESILDSSAGNRNIGYSYDPVGNRLVRTDSVEGNTSYTYDNNDRMLTESLAPLGVGPARMTTYGYDNNGNTLSRVASAVDRVFYDWDYENRLIAADTNGDSANDVSYRYDADGIRVSSIAAGQETRFLIDTVQPYQQVIEEYTPGGIIKVTYVHGLDLISQNRPAETGRSYYQVDGLGSTRALTNSTGLITDRYIYDAFGRTLGQVGRTGNVYLFAGEQRDAATGLDYLRARYLNVGTGRFLGMDTFEGNIDIPSSLHRLSYVSSNPANFIDPSGNITISDATLTSTLLDYLSRFQVRPPFSFNHVRNVLSLVRVYGRNLVGHRGKPIIVDVEFVDEMQTIHDIAKRHNVTVVVTDSFRLKSDPTGVTNSNHKAGHGIDMNVKGSEFFCNSECLGYIVGVQPPNENLKPEVVAFIQEIRGEGNGIRWGGDFQTGSWRHDVVHIDDGLNERPAEYARRRAATQVARYPQIYTYLK